MTDRPDNSTYLGTTAFDHNETALQVVERIFKKVMYQRYRFRSSAIEHF